MKKYMTGNTTWRVEAKIEEVEVLRETESSVWVKGRRLQKVTEWNVYHDTWDEAHSYLLEKAKGKVEYARRQLEEHKSYLGNVKGMKNPESAEAK